MRACGFCWSRLACGWKPSGTTTLNSCGFRGAQVTEHKLLPVIIGRQSHMCLMKTTVGKKNFLALFLPCHLAKCPYGWNVKSGQKWAWALWRCQHREFPPLEPGFGGQALGTARRIKPKVKWSPWKGLLIMSNNPVDKFGKQNIVKDYDPKKPSAWKKIQQNVENKHRAELKASTGAQDCKSGQ